LLHSFCAILKSDSEKKAVRVAKELLFYVYVPNGLKPNIL